MKYRLSYSLAETKLRCETGEVVSIPSAEFRKLTSKLPRLAKLLTQARRTRRPVRFECGAPIECRENYQRSLITRQELKDMRSSVDR